MTQWVYRGAIALSFFMASHPSYAFIMKHFKNDDNSTKWQHVANFSSGVLITFLTISIVFLYISHRKAKQANAELNTIKKDLEQRVIERTETLNESNQKLADSNRALEGEITEHKQTATLLQQSESYISNILQSMPSMLVSLTDDLKVSQWNKTAEKITGVTYEQAVGNKLWDVYPTITIAEHDVQRVLNTLEPLSIKHSQRGQYYFDITVFPLQGNVGRGVVILVDNVTQRTLAENMLIHKDKMSSMGELAATVAHDIDTPLQAMLVDIQKVRDQLENSEAAKPLLKDALFRGRQTAEIIKNLLELSRAQGDKKAYANLPKLMKAALKLASNVLNEQSGIRFNEIAITQEVEPELPELLCYASEVRQVFFNLIRHCYINLFDIARDNWQPEIHIEIKENYDAIWLKIQHNGRGLSIEEQQEIFEPFFAGTDGIDFNAAKSTVEHRLSFSHFIISDHHQGQVAITSAEDVGTTFHVQLPLIK